MAASRVMTRVGRRPDGGPRSADTMSPRLTRDERSPRPAGEPIRPDGLLRPAPVTIDQLLFLACDLDRLENSTGAPQEKLAAAHPHPVRFSIERLQKLVSNCTITCFLATLDTLQGKDRHRALLGRRGGRARPAWKATVWLKVRPSNCRA